MADEFLEDIPFPESEENKVSEKAQKRVVEDVTKLYEALHVSNSQFVSMQEIGALHEKQMQTLYRDFSRSYYERLK